MAACGSAMSMRRVAISTARGHPNRIASRWSNCARAWETGTPVGFSTPIAGTVEDVIQRFLPIVQGKLGLITHIGIEVRPPGTKTEDVERTLTLFAKEVMPVLKAEATKRGI